MNNIFVRLTPKEQTLFAKRLSFLIRAGVPILESLRLLRKSRSKQKTKIFDSIITDVENGQFLATSMEKFRHIFGSFAISIVRVGESAGILDQNLNYLAEELKKNQEIRRKVIGSLIYPCVIVAATIGIVILLLTFVFPKILPVFASMKVILPWPTKAMIVLSGLAIHQGGYIILGAAVLAAIFLVLFKKIDNVKLAAHHLILRLPVVGHLVRSYQLTNFFRTFGLLLKSGVNVSAAVAIVADSVSNLVYKNEFLKLAKSISKGKGISAEIDKKTGLFPEIAVQMVATGEHSGNLSETMIYLSEMYENEVDELTKDLSSAVEPFLMVFMGVLVGFVAISIIMPIYQITQNMKI